jgi:DNA repair exonuclease SbcCD nuclease subunit
MPEKNAGEHVEQTEETGFSAGLDGNQQGMQGVITVVLTADNHLGSTAFAQHPRKREERRRQLRQAFQRATDFAVGQGVDLFIQAGDLFDTSSPDERDRSFVAERLAQLRQAGIRSFALGGIHDTPVDTHNTGWMTGSELSEVAPAPQISYARLGALHYFAPVRTETREKQDDGEYSPLQPVIVDVRGVCVGICGLGVLADTEGNPLAHLHVGEEIERAALKLLILHAPIEGFSTGSSMSGTHAQVSRASIANQSVFSTILAGYHHQYRRQRIGHCDVVVAGATQRLDFNDPDDDPGFVFLGLATDGYLSSGQGALPGGQVMRWCNHLAVDSAPLRQLVVHTSELWPGGTDYVIEQLRPLCDARAMVQLRLEGELTRRQYHQLDLNQIRRYGEEHCFALAIDDSALSFVAVEPRFAGIPLEGSKRALRANAFGDASQRSTLAYPPDSVPKTPVPTERTPEEVYADFEDAVQDTSEQAVTVENWGRLSLREELVALADEWMAAAKDEQEKKALQATKEELLAAMDEGRERK